MGKNYYIKQIISFISLILIQVIFFRNQVLFGYAFCFIYIMPLLQLPVDTPRITNMLLAFVTGFIIDLFYNTLGINAGACVLIAFLRPTIITLTSSSGDLETGEVISIKSNGFQWFSIYSLILIFIHHTFLFLAEAFTFDHFFLTFKKILFSTILTWIVLIIIQNLIATPLRRR